MQFFPKNKTLTAKSSTGNKPAEFNLEDMMQEFGSNIPVQESNERLKKMLTAPPEILDKIPGKYSDAIVLLKPTVSKLHPPL